MADRAASRADVVSSFLAIKGALIEESYAALRGWDLAKTKAENLAALKATNPFGASSETWIRDVAKVVNRRFDPAGRDRPLMRLAQAGLPLEEWKPLLLWHITRDEFLLRDFLTTWLFPAWETGTFRLTRDDLQEYLLTLGKRGGRTEHPWSTATTRRVASALLKLAVEFGLLKGVATKEFTSYHLPETSFLYLLHAVAEAQPNASRLLEAPDWRMYLMRPEDVERELLRLHQFQRLDYQVAGSLRQLRLPHASSLAYAESWTA